MRKKNYKGRCEKISLSKCQGVCKTYDPIQMAYATMLQEDAAVTEFWCNVVLDSEEYTTDFLCTKDNGEQMVRECVQRSHLTKPMLRKEIYKQKLIFPVIYPDELLYSQLARYHARSGNLAYIFTAEQLFQNKAIRPDVEFLNAYTSEALFIITSTMPIEDIVMKHTMFPYYGRFLKSERRSMAFDSLVNMRTDYRRLLPIPKNRTVRYVGYGGGHCMFIYGWDERGWKIQNSWGEDWGVNGTFILPYEMGMAECWAVLDDIVEGAYVKKPFSSKTGKFFAKIINKVCNVFHKN